MRYFLLTLVAVASYFSLFAQNLPIAETGKINKLKSEIKQQEVANNQAKIAELKSKIAFIFLENNGLDSAIIYFNDALRINNKLNNKNAQAKINSYLGAIYFDKADYKNALDCFQDAQKELKKSNNKYEQATVSLNIAQTYVELKQNDKAIKNLENAEELANELYNVNLLKTISLEYVEIYKRKGDLEKQAEYYQKYQTYDKYISNETAKNELNKTKTQIDSMRSEKERTLRSLRYSQQEILQQDSLILLKSDSLTSAIKIAKAQEMQIKLNDLKIQQQKTQSERNKLWIVLLLSTFIGTSALVVLLFIMNRAKQKANKLLAAKNTQIKSQTEILASQNLELRKLSVVAAKTDNAILIMDAMGNFEWVNESFTRIFGKTFEELVLSTPNIVGPNTPPRIVQIIHHCIEHKETVVYDLHITSAKNKDLTVHVTLTPILNKNSEIEKLIAIDADITELRKANHQIEKQNEILELQNQHIKSSIQYAKNIQTASLPSLVKFHKHFDSFLIYKPKDIVSGDFYWLTNLSDNLDDCNRFIITIVDCTGHGVPGAFMSLIGIQLLNEITLEKKNQNPAEIIHLLDQKIISSLSQKTSENNDGMDLAMIWVEIKENNKVKLKFAGAKRPLYAYRSQTNVIETIKGSRRSVGGIKKTTQEAAFELNTLELNAGDSIYLTSDGITDQPNPQRIRFGSTQWIQLLHQIATEPMELQKTKILDAYYAHTLDTPQRDDITMLGIRF